MRSPTSAVLRARRQHALSLGTQLQIYCRASLRSFTSVLGACTVHPPSTAASYTPAQMALATQQVQAFGQANISSRKPCRVSAAKLVRSAAGLAWGCCPAAI